MKRYPIHVRMQITKNNIMLFDINVGTMITVARMIRPIKVEVQSSVFNDLIMLEELILFVVCFDFYVQI